VLVLRPGALGDTLLALPALRALKRAGFAVTLAAHAGAARLLESLGEITRGRAFDDPSLAWIFSDRTSIDTIVAWMSAEVPGAAILAPSQPPDGSEHVARYLLRTLAPLNIDRSLDDSPLRVTPIVADEILIHPGSGSRTKNWPAEHFASVIRALSAPVRLIVGEADFEVADEVESRLDHSLDRLELPTLIELAQRLAGCRAYVGNDSGVSHLAGLCGTRTVAIFGPTNPDIWRPIGPRVDVRRFDSDPDEIADLLAQ
jgi:ADP-heptose:LPS heptosyltransferase